MKVLHVEADAGEAERARRELERAAPHVVLELASSLGAARSCLAAGGHDLVLCALRLSDGSGLDLLDEIRRSALPVPLVMLAAPGDEAAAVEACRRGASDFRVKHPGYLCELPVALDNALDRDRLAREQDGLRESESRYRDLVESGHDLICSHDLAGNLLTVNEAGCRASGYPRAVLLRMNLADLLTAEARPLFPAYLAEVEKSGRARGVMAVESAHGEVRYWEYDNSLRPGEGGASLVRGVARDVTERLLAERTLREAEERLHRAVSAGNVGLWDWDLRTNKVYYSREWKSQIGYGEGEISGELEEWRSRVHPEDLPGALEAVQASLASPWRPYQAEFRFRHKDGSFRSILARGSLLRDEEGRRARILGSHVDITERVQLEAQLRQAQRMESVGLLAGGIAHDFNNLLTIVNGMAELGLMQVAADHPVRVRLEEIQRAGMRAADLTRQLLVFSRRQILQPKVLDLNRLLADLEKMLRRVIGEDVVFAFEPDDGLGRVKADPGQIEQVILNLVINARDAMPTGGRLTIATHNLDLVQAPSAALAALEPGAYVALVVSDTGSGIDEATRERIFEPFFTTKEAGKGTGLGLSMVYGIVQQSGGHIGLASEVGVGSTFTIYLPRLSAIVEQAAVAAAEAAPAGGAETILIVEDEPAVRSLARQVLESVGYRALAVASGEEALELLGAAGEMSDVRLLLTDVVMPGISGRELAERVAVLAPRVKVLFMSGYTGDAVVDRGVLEGHQQLISKPFTMAELTHRVRAILDARD